MARIDRSYDSSEKAQELESKGINMPRNRPVDININGRTYTCYGKTHEKCDTRRRGQAAAKLTWKAIFTSALGGLPLLFSSYRRSVGVCSSELFLNSRKVYRFKPIS